MRTFKVQLSEKRWGEGSCYSFCVSPHYVREPPRKFMSLCFNGDTKNLNQVYTADNWHRQVSNQACLLFFVLCPQPSGGSHYRSGRQTIFIMLDAIILQIYLEPGFLSFFFFFRNGHIENILEWLLIWSWTCCMTQRKPRKTASDWTDGMYHSEISLS